MMMRLAACLIALALSAPASAASRFADPCSNAPLPPEPWTSWDQSGAETAAGEVASAPRLILGKPIVATLRPSAQVQYAFKPAHQRRRSYGGLFNLAVKARARVGIGLSDAARIDIVTGRTSVASAADGHGPACSGVRQIVWFDLSPGVYLIQLSDAPASQVRIMAADALANQPLPPKRY